MTTLFELAARLQSANAAEGMLWMVLKATLILAIARLLLMVMPHASAAMKHLVATAALVGVAAMPVPALVLRLPVANDQSPENSRPGETTPATGNGQRATVGLSDNEPIATAISVARASGLADAPISVIERATNVYRSTWKGMIVVAIGIA